MDGSWNLRTTPNPLIRAAGRGLARANARHPWDHNAHFHRWILRSLPRRMDRVLDVGCGRGALLARVAARTQRVDGIDPDAGMARTAAAAVEDLPGVEVHQRTLAEHAALPGTAGAYDAVTMVASLHHQDLEQALNQARALLRPGGRLLVVALVQASSPSDHLWDIANALSNPLIGLVKHPRPVPRDADAGADAGVGAGQEAMPVQEASTSLAELRSRARAVLPGAVIRRREGFRVTLSWQRPADVGPFAAEA